MVLIGARAAGVEAVGADHGADRADPCAGGGPAPRRPAPGHHAAGAAAPGGRRREPERGRHVRRKPGAGRGGRGLNRAIADAAPGELRRQLGYKTTWYGSQLVVADRWYPSSKTCSACGAVKAKLALADRQYQCDHCGAVLDRDLNAAINLARLSEHALRVEGRPAGSGPVAGRGAIRKTSPPTGAAAGGDETSTPHSGQPPPVRRGPPLRKERLPDHETEVDEQVTAYLDPGTAECPHPHPGPPSVALTGLFPSLFAGVSGAWAASPSCLAFHRC